MRDQRSASALSSHDLSPAERSLRARLAVHTLHATRDASRTTALARAGFLARFEREVDPDSTLELAERQRRAAQARSAYFTRLSLQAVKARKARRVQRSQGGEAA
jgi:hypothetical protein